ncbi:hypothetical protein [Rhizobium sp. FKY42]|uniref:hypothetical protein n=1 Tax=Rhizobium sp. FKY42 TaxID=2562310 RepID=UPI0010BF6D4D|nr:hypothetical protein [Rhizobium sp. FKY42]
MTNATKLSVWPGLISRHSKGVAKGSQTQKKQGVLISKRDRHNRFPEKAKSPLHETAPTTFLFLLNIQLSNNRPHQQSKLRRQPSIRQTEIRHQSAFANQMIIKTSRNIQDNLPFLKNEGLRRQQRRRPRQ